MSRQLQQIVRVVTAVHRATGGRLGVPATLAIGGVVLLWLWVAPGEWRVPPPDTRPAATSEAPSPDGASPAADAADVLTEVRRGVYRSPAGLRYTRGSRHGHRLTHLMAHCEDEPGRDGPHGVFDADDAADVVLLVDEAYRRAESGRGTRTRRDGARTIHTVDLGRRVGYVGGQTGARRGRPTAEHVRLVIEGDRLITAYPVVP